MISIDWSDGEESGPAANSFIAPPLFPSSDMIIMSGCYNSNLMAVNLNDYAKVVWPVLTVFITAV